MDGVNNDINSRRELEAYLNVLYSSYSIFNMHTEWVIRGVLKPSFSKMRRLVESYLKSFNGRYNFEDVGKETYLTITASVNARQAHNWKLHISLFVATVFTTILVGSLREGGDPLASLADLSLGLPFSVAILLILLVHEMGHYFAARYHGMDVTLPFFIPMPPPFIFGTMGAVIKMRSPLLNRRMLLDVGAAGPIAGFIVSVPVVIIGLMSSEWTVYPSSYFITGESLLFSWLAKLIIGPAPAGAFLKMSSVAFAGWIGFFVTAMNMLPIGQLDGGHVAYALLGKRHTQLAYGVFFMMLVMGFLWPGWILWAVLILVLIRVKHPPLLDENVPLSKGRRIVGIITFIILILTFMPLPILA